MNISSSQTVSQKGVNKMGPKEYNDIKYKIGKLLAIPGQEQNETNSELQQNRDQLIAKQIEDINNFDNIRSMTPSSNTLSIDSIHSKSKFQFNGQIIFSPQTDLKKVQSVQSLSKNGSPKSFQKSNIQKPQTEQTNRRRNYSQAVTSMIKEEEETQTQIKQIPKTSENKKEKVVEGSLLTKKNEVQYINHLRKAQSKMSFHDHMNYLELDSHIHELCEQQSLFTNRNVIYNINDKESNVIVPKKYDDFHVTEGIVPYAFDEIKVKQRDQLSKQIFEKINQNQQTQDQISTNEYKTHNPKLKNKNFSTISYSDKTKQILVQNNNPQHMLPQSSQRSSAYSVYSSPKDVLATTFTQTMAGGLPNTQVQNNINLLTSSYSKSTNRPLTQQGFNKTGFKFHEISQKQQQEQSKSQSTKNFMQQLLQGYKSKSSIDLKQVSRQNSQDVTNKIDLAAQKPKPVYVEQKIKLQKRQEVLNVKKWMEDKLDELVKIESLSINQVFTYFQNVFQASISEILRQIASECKERSQLLQEIWDSQISMSEKIFISLSKENNRIEQTSLEEINRLHKSYQNELQKQFQMIDDRNQLISDLKKQLQQSITESRINRKKGQKVEKNYKIINNQINQLQEEYNLLFQENLALLMNQNKIDWQTALKEKKKMLEEINLNRKMRNNLIKVGESFKKEKLTLEEQMKKHEIDEIVRQFVIDRESNMPVTSKKIEEEEEEQERLDELENELDENKQVVLKEFWKNQSADTSDLIEMKNAETNTQVFQTSDGQTQTKKTKLKENGAQVYIQIELVDQSIQTETECYNVFCQTVQAEVKDIMVQCDLIQEIQQNDSERRKKQELKKEHSNQKIKKGNQVKKKKQMQVSQNSQYSNEQQSSDSYDLSIIYTDSANDTETFKSDEIFQTKRKNQKSSFQANDNINRQLKQISNVQESSGDESKSQIYQSLNSSKLIKSNKSAQSTNSKYKEKDKSSSIYFITGLDEIENKDFSIKIDSKSKSIFSPKQRQIYLGKQLKQNIKYKPKSKDSSRQTALIEQKRHETSLDSSNISYINENQLQEVKDLFKDKENISKSDNILKIQELVDQTITKSQQLSAKLQREVQKYQQIIKEKEEEIKQSKKYQIQLIAKLDKQQKDSKAAEKKDKKQNNSQSFKKTSIQIENEDLDTSQLSERQGGGGSSGRNSLFKEEYQNRKQQKKNFNQNRNFSSYVSSAYEQEKKMGRNVGNQGNQISPDSQKAGIQLPFRRKQSKQTSIFCSPAQKKEMSMSQIGSQNTISNSNIQQENNVQSTEEIFNELRAGDRAIHTEQLIQNTVEEQSQMIQRNFKVQQLNLNFTKKENRRDSINSDMSTPKSNLAYTGHYSQFSGHQQQSKSPYSSLTSKQKDISSPQSGQSKKKSLIYPQAGQLDSPRSSIFSNSPSQNSRSQNKQYSINTEAALQQKNKISSFISDIKVPKNALKYMPQILKMINSIISDNFKCLKSHQQILNPLYIQMYEYFLYLFGLRKVAELKMISVIEQCVLMQNEYPQIDIFMNLYFNDYSSVDLHFFCKTYMLLCENIQQVKVEKSTTNKYRILTTIPQVLKKEQYQREVLDQIKIFEQKLNQQKNNENDQENNKKLDNIDLLQINNLSSEIINELNQQKFDVFEVIQFFMTTFKLKKQQLQVEYMGLFYAISSNMEKAFIDEEGVQLLSFIVNLDEQKMQVLNRKFKSQSIMNEMSYDQFILLANEQTQFKTQQILDMYPDQVKSLLEIKEFWAINKQQYEEKVQVTEYYNLFTKNIMEKLDILTQLMEQDQADINDNSYLKRHEQSFQICYIIVNKIYQI
ncbi:hypothetical protein ABPG72_008260 [Tetrahymena utriculariae]